MCVSGAGIKLYENTGILPNMPMSWDEPADKASNFLHSIPVASHLMKLIKINKISFKYLIHIESPSQGHSMASVIPQKLKYICIGIIILWLKA